LKSPENVPGFLMFNIFYKEKRAAEAALFHSIDILIS